MNTPLPVSSSETINAQACQPQQASNTMWIEYSPLHPEMFMDFNTLLDLTETEDLTDNASFSNADDRLDDLIDNASFSNADDSLYDLFDNASFSNADDSLDDLIDNASFSNGDDSLPKDYQSAFDDDISVEQSLDFLDETVKTVDISCWESNVDLKGYLETHFDSCDSTETPGGLSPIKEPEEEITNKITNKNAKQSQRKLREKTQRKQPEVYSGVKKYKCNVCDKSFSVNAKLNRHKFLHCEGKLYQCKHCSFASNHSHSLKYHVNTCHEGEKRFSCDQCDYKAVYRSRLEKHMLTHTREKPFSCDECEFKAVELRHLKLHMAKHTGVKPFSCDKCEFKTAKKHNLKDHMKKHVEKKTFTCKLCNFETAYNSCLLKHVEIHNKGKLFSCEVCDFTTTYKIHFESHVKSHSKKKRKKRLACTKCNYVGITKVALMAHMKMHRKKRPFSGFKIGQCSSVDSALSNRAQTVMSQSQYNINPNGHQVTDFVVESNTAINQCNLVNKEEAKGNSDTPSMSADSTSLQKTLFIILINNSSGDQLVPLTEVNTNLMGDNSVNVVSSIGSVPENYAGKETSDLPEPGDIANSVHLRVVRL